VAFSRTHNELDAADLAVIKRTRLHGRACRVAGERNRLGGYGTDTIQARGNHAYTPSVCHYAESHRHRVPGTRIGEHSGLCACTVTVQGRLARGFIERWRGAAKWRRGATDAIDVHGYGGDYTVRTWHYSRDSDAVSHHRKLARKYAPASAAVG